MSDCGKDRSKFALTRFVRLGLISVIHHSGALVRFGSSADSRDDRSDFRLGRIAEIGVDSFDGPILAEHRGTERRELRPLLLHKPTSGSPLSSSDLIGQECLECAFSRTSVASILDHQVTAIDQPVDDGAGCVDVEVL